MQQNSNERSLDVLILAAGLGTRMKSGKAKVLHHLGGRALISHVARAALVLAPRKIFVVVGHQASEVEQTVRLDVPEHLAAFVLQSKQLGTGDAVMAAKAELANARSTVLVLSGDVPLIKPETLSNLVRSHHSTGATCSLLSVRMENPFGYGRILRNEAGAFSGIVEQKDAIAEQLQIREINVGIYCFQSNKLFGALTQVRPANQQGEYYLTDVPALLQAEGEPINVFSHDDSREVSGINTRAELAEFENLLRRATIRKLLVESGVTFIDPSHAYVSADAEIGRDCIIYPDVIIEGQCVIGEGCVIRSGTRITNSRLGANVVVKDYSIIVDSEVEANCTIGPFAHLRLNARLGERSSVGNFVEIKKSTLGKGSKAMHLAYLGDCTIGENTNIGAGTITCNYDGQRKHATIIEDNVRIGSDTMLVAPVRVGSRSVTGAGSVVTRDVPPDSLVVGVPAKIRKHLAERKDEKEGQP